MMGRAPTFLILLAASCSATNSLNAAHDSGVGLDASGAPATVNLDGGADVASGLCELDGGLACEDPIAACSTSRGFGCPPIDWAAAQKACADFQPSGLARLATLRACAGYDTLYEQGTVEGQQRTYYDHATRSPVAVVWIGGTGPFHCLGAACFVEPSDCVDVSPCPPPGDGGTEADVDTDGN